MLAGLLFLLQKYFKIASTKSRNLLLLLFFFSIFSYFYIFDDDDDDDDVIMTSFTDILKTCIPIHLCLLKVYNGTTVRLVTTGPLF